MLRRLAWLSIPSSSFSTRRLHEIIAPARRHNERNRISGMLMFSGAQFLSVLEGDDRDLSKQTLARKSIVSIPMHRLHQDGGTLVRPMMTTADRM